MHTRTRLYTKPLTKFKGVCFNHVCSTSMCNRQSQRCLSNPSACPSFPRPRPRHTSSLQCSRIVVLSGTRINSPKRCQQRDRISSAQRISFWLYPSFTLRLPITRTTHTTRPSNVADRAYSPPLFPFTHKRLRRGLRAHRANSATNRALPRVRSRDRITHPTLVVFV